MYLEHFGLAEQPFRITPDTEVFFRGANRGATLEALTHAIVNDEGIVKVTGEVGSGKTTLCRVLIERLPEQVDTILLANPSLSRDEILFALADEMKLSLPTQRISVLVRELQNCLIDRFANGRRTVVLVDEAHAMPRDTLEEIRLLSNLETNRHKLLQIVLFGQPELNSLLGVPEMRQIRERITHNFTLEPLVRSDISEYIDFRMRAAGYHGPTPFDDEALRLIARKSRGLTRRINILADKSLLAAFAGNTHRVTGKEVRAAVKDAEFVDPPRWPLFAAIGGLIAVLAGGAGFLAWQHNQPAAATTAIPSAAPVAPAILAPAAPTASAGVVALPASPTAGAPATTVSAPQGTPPSTPIQPAQGANPPPLQAPPTAAPMGIQGATGTPPVPAPWSAPTGPAAASSAPLPAQAAGPSLPPGFGPRTRAHLESSTAWLASAQPRNWTLQMLTSPAVQSAHIEHFAARAAAALGKADAVHVLMEVTTGEQRLVVLVGDYPSRPAALAALAKLPKDMRSYKPYPRQISVFKARRP